MSKDGETFWDAPAFRPVLGRRGPRPTTFKVAVMQRLQALGGKWGGSSSGRRPAPRDVRSAPKFSRRCVVKARYVQMRGQGIKAARLHLDYIEREGVERDGSKGRLFNPSGDVDRQQFGASIEGERRQFRQELATKELGPRPEIEMQQQLTKEVSQERLTGIDRRLAELVLPDGSLDMASLARGSLSKPHAMARLETLAALALAERTSPTSWRFKDSWQETLKHMGERGDIIKRMHQALHGQPHMYRVFDPGAGDGAAEIEGVVRHKGLHDELGGDLYAIVQTPRGEAHYLRVDQATAEQLKEGERVRIKSAPELWVKGPEGSIPPPRTAWLRPRAASGSARGSRPGPQAVERPLSRTR
jgi:type IV secretory pathway VirD2 relaxase